MSIRVALVTIIATLVAACGGGQGGVRTGTMPEGGTFHGVWFSPQYGEMHLCQSSSRVIGEYEKDERHGTIQGDVDGDVLFFDWSEDREMVVGRPTVTKGRGYFRLLFEEDGRYYLDGEWGLEDSVRGGGSWRAVKLADRQPERCYDSVRRPQEGLDALPEDSLPADGSGDAASSAVDEAVSDEKAGPAER